MVEITASEAKDTLNLNDNDVSDTNFEYIIDGAVDLLNLFGADLPNMRGTAGSKTLNVESKERGAIMIITRTLWYGYYKKLENVTVSNIGTSLPDVLGNSTITRLIQQAANRLKEIDVDTG